MAFLLAGCQSDASLPSTQSSEPAELFEDIYFEELDVHIVARRKFSSHPFYPFVGRPLPDAWLHRALPTLDDDFWADSKHASIYATHRFALDPQTQGYIIRTENEHLNVDRIDLLVQDDQTEQFLSSYNLALASGQSATLEYSSWVADFDRDGYYDIATYRYNMWPVGDELQIDEGLNIAFGKPRGRWQLKTMNCQNLSCAAFRRPHLRASDYAELNIERSPATHSWGIKLSDESGSFDELNKKLERFKAQGRHGFYLETAYLQRLENGSIVMQLDLPKNHAEIACRLLSKIFVDPTPIDLARDAP